MKKKILHIQLLPLLSGVQNVMLHILQALPEEEFEIYIACKPGGPLEQEIKRRGYHFIALPMFIQKLSPLDLLVFIKLYILCRKYRFNIVHTHSSKPGFLGRIAARLAGVPLIIHTGHGAPFYETQPPVLQRFYMELERLAAVFCDKMVFVNYYHRDFYIAHKLIRADKAITIYNALNPEMLRQIDAAAEKKNHRNNITTIGSVLRFSMQKNIVMTISTVIKICRQRDDVRFIFVGDGELYNLCKMMVEINNLQDRIILPGWQSDTAIWLSGFDVFMLYSAYEGLPMSIIEAMYAGLPIIGADIPTIAELVDSDNGWLIPSRRADILETKLHSIIDDKNSYGQKGQVSRTKIQELCSYEKFTTAYLSLYRYNE